MISTQEAQKAMEENLVELPVEYVDLISSVNRVLHDDIFTQEEHPSYDRSMMDGYAIGEETEDKQYTIKGIIKAGEMISNPVAPGQCYKIMTGAAVPSGCQQVIPFEEAKEQGNKMIITSYPRKKHIQFKGEDLKKGDLLLNKRTQIHHPQLAILSGAGILTVPVYKRPEIGLINTGDEIVEAENTPPPGKIRNSNRYSLTGICKENHLPCTYLGNVDDTLEVLTQKIQSNTPFFDALILTGGVSMGEYDFVKEACKQAGADIIFHKVSVKPGKPFLFAKKNRTLIFGCPGHPVSNMVIFLLFILPTLNKMQGLEERLSPIYAELGMDFTLKNAEDRDFFIPVTLKHRENKIPQVYQIEYHGSAHINAYAFADGMIMVERGKKRIKKGEIVHVRSILP